MNINFFITSLGGGGAERVVCNLANYLTERQHTIRITVLRGKDKTYPLNNAVVVDYLQPDYYIGKNPCYFGCTRFTLRSVSSGICVKMHYWYRCWSCQLHIL